LIVSWFANGRKNIKNWFHEAPASRDLTSTKRIGRFSSFNNNINSTTSSVGHLPSFYKETDWKRPLLDWDKPLFSQHRSSLDKVLVHAKKAAEKSRRFIDNIESKKQSCISRARSIPENATIRKEYVKCGKVLCYHGKHGPYYYAYWKDPETKKLKKKYIGQYFQWSSEGKAASPKVRLESIQR